MPGNKVDRRRFNSVTPFAAQAEQKMFKGHIAFALHEQSHGIANRTATAMQAMQLDHAIRPLREPVCLAKEGRVHPFILDKNIKRTRAKLPHPAGVSP
jgi:hypothetical protein